jgi:hypothetical protein
MHKRFYSSIKKDKLHQIIYNYQQQNDLKKQLLVIKNLADNYPNSGSLTFRKFPNNRIALFFIVGKNTIIISVSNNMIIHIFV